MRPQDNRNITLWPTLLTTVVMATAIATAGAQSSTPSGYNDSTTITPSPDTATSNATNSTTIATATDTSTNAATDTSTNAATDTSTNAATTIATATDASTNAATTIAAVPPTTAPNGVVMQHGSFGQVASGRCHTATSVRLTEMADLSVVECAVECLSSATVVCRGVEYRQDSKRCLLLNYINSTALSPETGCSVFRLLS